jgi:uncharacterized protein YjiK
MKLKNIFFSLGDMAASLCPGCLKNDSVKNHIIASIPEASGISYCTDTNTLVIANDEGKFYEITPNGDILATHSLGNYDLEGVVCEDDRFVFAIENGDLLGVNRKTLQQNLYSLEKVKKLGKKNGIEGIAKVGDNYLLTIQTKDKEEASFMLVAIADGKTKVLKTIHHGIIDSAGLDYKDGILYIVSDKKDKLYLYDLEKEKEIKKIKLPSLALEGVALDEKGNIFFADDNGAILRYTLEELKLDK